MKLILTLGTMAFWWLVSAMPALACVIDSPTIP